MNRKMTMLVKMMQGVLRGASVAECMEAIVRADRLNKRERSKARWTKRRLETAEKRLTRKSRKKPPLTVVPPITSHKYDPPRDVTIGITGCLVCGREKSQHASSFPSLNSEEN